MADADKPLESWLRDAIFDNPWDLLQEAFPEDFEADSIPSIIRWKEFRTGAGRIDLLMAYPGRVVVVELKRELIDEGAVAQCLRYVGAVRTEFYLLGDHAGSKISGLVAAPKITDGGRFACIGGNVTYCRIKPAVISMLDDAWPNLQTREREHCYLEDAVEPGQRMQRHRLKLFEAQVLEERAIARERRGFVSHD